MASSFLDNCGFNPTLGGTTDWTYSSALASYQSPTAAGAVNGQPYSYYAKDPSGSPWEIGSGVCTITGGVPTFARTTVLSNSSGTGTAAGQSGAGTKIPFSGVPQVVIVALAEDLLPADATRRNIILNSIRSAKALGSVQPFVDAVADGFGGSDGINAGASSNYSLDTTNKRVINGTTNTDNYSTAITTGVNSNNPGWGGYTVRGTIAPAALASLSGTKMRLTVVPPTTGANTVINKIYVGFKGTGTFDFDGAQVQVFFSAAAGVTLTAGGAAVVSDGFAFTYDNTKTLVYAIEYGATTDLRFYPSSGSNFKWAFKAASADSATTVASGYTDPGNNNGATVSLIECRTSITTTYNNMIVAGNGYDSLDFVPSTLRAAAVLEPVDASTLNTDGTIEVSRDNGTTWSAASLVQYHTLGTKIYAESAPISVTGQPSGSKPAFRYKSFNNKRLYLHGVMLTAAS